MLLICCLVCFPSAVGFCVGLWFFLLLFFCNHLEEEERDALLLLAYGCLVTVNILCLSLPVPRVGLWCVIVVFPDHTHLLFA